MNGILVVNKPSGWTSHDVVARVRRIAQERSVGHLGTLDPMATGVLPLVLGKFTRLAHFYGKSEKEYEGVIRLGFSTDTYDAEGDPVGEVGDETRSLEVVRRAAAAFCGNIEQFPPPFSAKKIKGVPAYELARKKEKVVLRPVSVEVFEFEVLAVEGDRVRFTARVGSGTYIRSIAHDLGQTLGTGAHLAELRRTRSGDFSLEDSVVLPALESDGLTPHLIAPERILPKMPTVYASEEQMARVRHGNAVNLMELSGAPWVKVMSGKAELVAVACRIAGTLFQPRVVLCGGDSDNINVR